MSEATSIGAWLDTIKPSFGGRFSSAFETLGIEDTTDLADIEDDILEDLMQELAAVGAKKLPCRKIRNAIKAAQQPAASTRAKLEAALALDSEISATSSSQGLVQPQSTAVVDWLARSTKRFACFLSHHKVDCAMEARFFKTELERLLGGGAGVFLDSDDLHDLNALLRHVRDSEVLVLLQSKEVLLRPWCLLELHTAIAERIPIVAINVAGKGYDFAEMASLCAHLDTRLEALNPGALDLVKHHGGVDPVQLSYELSHTIPNIISVPFNSSASAAVIRATISDVVDLMASAAKPTPSKQSFDDWLATRGAAPVPRREHGSIASATPLNESSRHTSTEGGARVPRGCPKLPGGYQIRAAIMDGIKTELLRGKGGRAVAIFGMGGSGKTVVGSALLRDAAVRAAFDKLVFLPIGQASILRDLLALAYGQLTGERLDAKLAETRAFEELRTIAAEFKVLLLIDDPWETVQVQSLNFLSEAQPASRLVVTTRIRDIVPKAAEFELGLLDADTAAALILEVAGEQGAPPYPTLLLEAAEACGRLALVCSIAGGILEAYGGEVDAEFVALLKEDHCEMLREGEHRDEHVAIEDRIITNSLRTFKGKDRERAEALFKLMGCFPEDVAVPIAVLDVMAPTLVDEGAKRPEMKVRSTATALLRCGLLRGAIGTGVLMHDIVRHHAIMMHSEEELRAKHRVVVKRLIESLGGRKARLNASKHCVPWYLRYHLWWNLKGGMGEGVVDEDFLAPLLRERKPVRKRA